MACLSKASALGLPRQERIPGFTESWLEDGLSALGPLKPSKVLSKIRVASSMLQKNVHPDEETLFSANNDTQLHGIKPAVIEFAYWEVKRCGPSLMKRII
jgi:hypothetical protein